MTVTDLMAELATLGDEQTRNTYLQQGMPETVYGVNFTRLSKLKRQLGKNQGLADGLWQTNEPDAQVLASMLLDPEQFSKDSFESWAKQVQYTAVADALGRALVNLPYANKLGEKFRKSKKEWLARIGWQEATVLAQKHQLSDDETEQLLAQIGEQMPQANDIVQDAMVMTLISIGLIDPTWRSEAEVVAENLGPLRIDSQRLGHKTPDPIQYLEKAWARKW